MCFILGFAWLTFLLYPDFITVEHQLNVQIFPESEKFLFRIQAISDEFGHFDHGRLAGPWMRMDAYTLLLQLCKRHNATLKTCSADERKQWLHEYFYQKNVVTKTTCTYEFAICWIWSHFFEWGMATHKTVKRLWLLDYHCSWLKKFKLNRTIRESARSGLKQQCGGVSF